MTPFPGNVFRDIIEEFAGKSKERDGHRRSALSRRGFRRKIF